MIVDASVAVKWLISEPDDDLAEALLARLDLSAPDLLKLEVGHVLGKLYRRGATSGQFTIDAWRALDDLPLQLHPSGELLHLAFDLSVHLGAAIYDCVYLALAQTTEDVFVTADERFARAVRGAAPPRLAARLRLLSDFR